MENSKGKKTMGRRKIEIKKIEKKTSLQVTFAKRRGGLFRKASELAVLCGAEVAIFVQSPADKIYTFSHPSVEAVINRLTLSPVEAEASSSLLQWQNARRCDDERRKCEEAMKMLEMEKMRAASEPEKKGRFWWEEPYEGLELHELEEFASALEDLGERVEERLKEFEKFSNSQCAPQDFCASSSDLVPYGGLSTDWDCLDFSDFIIDSDHTQNWDCLDFSDFIIDSDHTQN